jgi:hypothetical protein
MYLMHNKLLPFKKGDTILYSGLGGVAGKILGFGKSRLTDSAVTCKVLLKSGEFLTIPYYKYDQITVVEGA